MNFKKMKPISQKIKDEFLWLESLKSSKALDWVKEQNKQTENQLAKGKIYKQNNREILKIFEAKDKIPYVFIKNKQLYNFWQDDKHVRGILRRTSYSSYKTKNPKWEIVLDIDALAKKEKENWIYKGGECLHPEYRFCLIYLSRGGQDKAVIREFDLFKKEFVKAGFIVPSGKNHITWVDENHTLIASALGKDSVTESGYPRFLKLWKRGEPFSKAEIIYKAKKKDVQISAGSFYHGKNITIASRYIDFHLSELFVFDLEGRTLKKIHMPKKPLEIIGYFKNFLIFYFKDDFSFQGKRYKHGDIAALNAQAAGRRIQAEDLYLIFSPKRNQSFSGDLLILKDKIVFSVLEDVKPKIFWTEFERGRWSESLQLSLPLRGNITLYSGDNQSNTFFYAVEFPSRPPSFLSYSFGKKLVKLKSQPRRFKDKDIVVEQKFSKSKDGARIPYFLIYKKGIKYNGKNPVWLYGYGGFSSSLIPRYNPAVGKLFLEKGGVYVMANIRGGGEYGPRWHQAALKEKRQRAFDDFISVAEDLIQNNVTSPRHLAIEGGSNGGLLVGAVMAQRPELFKAAVIGVPLLDMIRYTELPPGASWIAEYGDPKIKKYRRAILKYSPYQNVFPDKKYPSVFIYTSALDDRVHPGHARKMAAKMQKQGHKVLYYESQEGGHSASANLKQKAKLRAMIHYFIRQNIF